MWENLVPKGSLTFGTLRYWCHTYNERRYYEILSHSYEHLLLNTVNDVAQVFAQDMHGTIVYDATSSDKQPRFWRYDEATRLWMNISSEQLQYLFVETMPLVCSRVSTNILERGLGREEVTKKADKVVKLQQRISGGVVMSYLKPLSTILHPQFSSNFKDKEFKLNDRPELLPLANGVFNFEKGCLEPYERQHFLSYRLDINYNTSADTSDIEKAMYQWYEGGTPEGKERIAFMKYWLGYCLTGYTTRHEFLVVYGEAGGNGKSLLFEDILGREVFGRHLYTTLSEDALTKVGGTNDSLVNMMGKRLACLSESGKEKFNMEALKRLTGGDAVSANAKYKNEVTFHPTAKIPVLCNKLPNMPADDGGTGRRIRYIKQNTAFVRPEQYASYPQDMKDKGLVYCQDVEFVKRLRANKEGWIKFLVEGAMEFMANPLKSAPKSVLEYSHTKLTEGDRYSSWIDANLLVTGDVNDKLHMRSISSVFLRDHGLNPQNTAAKTELINRLKRNPRLTTSGNVSKGRLDIHGLLWRVGCVEEDDDEADAAQAAYEVWLAGRASTDALMVEYLRS
jgi:P4 family phage/plasmid primase-like protien